MVKVLTNSQGKVYTSSGKALIAPSDTPSRYQLLDRVKDDNNNEIGTVSGFFTDANDVEYAVVCLDAQYRATKSWCSNTTTIITNLPRYYNLSTSNVWESKETATFNTQKILDFCTANGYTSQACTHCRSKSFTISGTVYYGQLPNVIELCDIAKRYNAIEARDTSSSSYTSSNFASARNIWASNQHTASEAFYLFTMGFMTYQTKSNESRFAVPVLEIPNAL